MERKKTVATPAGVEMPGVVTKLGLKTHQEIAMEIGSNIKMVRKSRKITLRELEKSTGIDIGTISKLENGVLTNPTLGVIARLFWALEIEFGMNLRAAKL